jgi:hypothetical protein
MLIAGGLAAFGFVRRREQAFVAVTAAIKALSGPNASRAVEGMNFSHVLVTPTST